MRRPLIPPGAVRLGVGIVVDVESSLLSFLLGEINDADDDELGDRVADVVAAVAAVELALVTRLVSIDNIRPAGDSFVMI